MKLQRVLIAFTIINMVLLVFLLAHRLTAAQDVVQVLRGHALEIVDDVGRVRASIAVHASQKLSDGSIYPETVLLRLINEDGRPNIKISAMTDGSGLLVGGQSVPAYINLVARGTTTSLTLIEDDGRKKAITP